MDEYRYKYLKYKYKYLLELNGGVETSKTRDLRRALSGGRKDKPAKSPEQIIIEKEIKELKAAYKDPKIELGKRAKIEIEIRNKIKKSKEIGIGKERAQSKIKSSSDDVNLDTGNLFAPPIPARPITQQPQPSQQDSQPIVPEKKGDKSNVESVEKLENLVPSPAKNESSGSLKYMIDKCNNDLEKCQQNKKSKHKIFKVNNFSNCLISGDQTKQTLTCTS